MGVDNIENIVMLLTAVIGLLFCLFRYIETPVRGWFYSSVFFLAFLLSDYYWTLYTLVIGSYPDVSALIAYFGWNVGYLVLFLLILHMRSPGSKRYFHPLMLIPIPLNIAQFLLYITFGGIINNVWQGTLLTATAVICLQSLLYYHKNRKNGDVFPFVIAAVLFFIFTQYGMWTASCFSWDSNLTNPYYYFAFTSYAAELMIPVAMAKEYALKVNSAKKDNPDGMHFQFLLQAIVSFVIFGGCISGYLVAMQMKNSIPAGSDESAYSSIAITLFLISIFISVLILCIIFLTAFRYRTMEKESRGEVIEKRSRFNLVFTLLVTLGLMVFTVVYNTRLLYNASTEKIYAYGMDKASVTATELKNYLTIAETALWATADTVDIMVQEKTKPDNIRQYIVNQTSHQKHLLDENFTGLYAYIYGEYMDGLGWEPPEGYDPESRDWYKSAVSGDGSTVIVSPYIDAQTNSMVITFCKRISGGKSNTKTGQNIVALDVITDHIQDLIGNADISGKGYGMIVDQNGMIIAHPDPELNGKNTHDVLGAALADSIVQVDKGTLDTRINDTDCTLFISSVMNQWYVVIVITDAELMGDLSSQIFVNIIISLGVFALISFFYYLSYRNEQSYSKKVEEMNISRQKQEYEAEVLKLEKLAADEANKAKGSFLADMSHEIRTPINAILGMNEMIMREAAGANILEYSRNIGASGRMLLQLINSILDFSKIEDGKMEIVPVRYSVRSLITYLVNSIRERASAKGLELIVNADPALPSELYGDDARINQVIMNLLTNAVKYTPEGSVTLTIASKEKLDKGILLYVEVKDTGMGIKDCDMDRLFQSFERLDVEKNRHIEGTGLGMSITTRLLALMGSDLQVQSVYGEGSVFSFELWQEVENDTPLGDYTVINETSDNSYYKESFHAPDADILIVDDTRMNIMVAINLLKKTELNIYTASNGPEAISLAEKNAYDLILMDQRMPEMDGTETMERIKALENGLNKDTPIICLTADALSGAREHYMEEGFTDYLTKPINGIALEKTLLKYLPKEKLKEVTADNSRKSAGDVSGKATDTSDVVTENIPDKTTVEPSSDNPAFLQEAGSDTEENAPGFDRSTPLFAALRKSGVDVVNGMVAFQNDEEFYKSILSEYASDHEDRRKNLTTYYDEKDWENYKILIHSLKSSSKTIGANELSSIALGLESAAKEGDGAAIEKDHDRAMEMYDTVVTAITDNLDISLYTFTVDEF